MKPIIKKQFYYSLLLMRDDTSVRTLRIRSSTIFSLLVFLLLIALGGGLGIWGGLHYWREYAVLSEHHKEQDRELGEARLQLERYVNYDTLLEAANGSATPLAKNEEVGASAPVSRLQNATQKNLSALASAQNATRLLTGADDYPSGRVGLNATLPQDGAAPSAVSDPQPASAAQAPSLPPISSGPLRINSFSGRIAGAQRLRIRYELATAPSEDQKAISGTSRYFATLADATEVELIVQDSSDTRFSITRMKLMEANVRLPQGMAARDIKQLYVHLELEEGSAYREMFPLTR